MKSWVSTAVVSCLITIYGSAAIAHGDTMGAICAFAMAGAGAALSVEEYKN